MTLFRSGCGRADPRGAVRRTRDRACAGNGRGTRADAEAQPPQEGRAEIRGAHRSGSRPGSSAPRSEEHTSELQSLMRISYAVFCLKKKTTHKTNEPVTQYHHRANI